jgi:6-phosphogluconolactonase (cycloisomerase 2 family)
MTIRRRFALQTLGLALALGSASPALHAYHDEDDEGFRTGKVFTSTNATAGNELLVYDTDRGGALLLATRLATQGIGSGGGLGNQGAVTLSQDGRHLFVVNAGSNSVSTFRVRRNGLQLTSVVDAGGQRPVSVAEHDGLVVVLNANGAGNIAGFRNRHGVLEPIAGATQPLSAAGGTAPAQVAFGEDGGVLIVTEKATNKLATYRVRRDGAIDAPLVTASSGMTPFGFAVDRRGTVLVSEAFGGAAGASALSSYTFSHYGVQPQLVSASVGSGQSAACWVVVTPNGRHAYVTNTASGNISAYAVERNGKAALAQAVAATTDTGPIDAAITPSGRALFVLNGAGRSIQSFAIGRDGQLQAQGRVDGLPAGANGLAAN